MATAFQTGFLGGTAMYNNAERNRLAQEQGDREASREVRAAELHKQSLEEGGLRVAGMRRVNDATDNLDRLTRVGVQNPDAIKANDADFDMAVAATGRGMAMPKAAPQQQEWRGATPVELNQSQMGLAAARGDVAGMETLRLGRKGIDYEEGYKKHSKEWADMDDAAKGALIDKLSLDSGVKGYGSWVPGKGKAAGYMNYLPPGGDPIKLSAKEAGDLYTLSSLMQVDPLRARGEMDKVSDKVRAIASQAFEAQSKGVTANNQATRFANADINDAARSANDAARTGLMGQELGLKRDLNKAQIGAYERSNQSPIVALTAEAERLVKAGTFKDVPTAIEALKKGSAKREVDPKAYAETLAKMNEVYGDTGRARMATDQLFGLTAPTNAVAESLKALNDKKGGAKPGAAGPAAPAAQLGLTQRLGNAVGADNAAGNRNQFITLADEAAKNTPAVMQQLEALRRAVPMTRSEGERNNLETRIGELEGDLGVYRSILEQRNAQRGY